MTGLDHTPQGAPTAPAAVGEAFKRAATVNRAGVSVRAGVVAAIPVAGMLGLGTALGSATAAVTMGVGAMLVGVAWRAGDGPSIPPIGTMAAAATALATATLAGTLSGHWGWLHLCVLVLVCLVAGLSTALGRRGAVVGNQSIIAFVVFGRFPEPILPALGLAGLVLAGGAAQTAFAALVAVPLAWRRQRAAVAVAYERLADLAGSLLGSGVPAATALDEADSILAAPAMFADRRLATLVNLVAEGRRTRLELIVLGAAVSRLRRAAPDTAAAIEPEVRATMARVQQTLALIASEIGDRAARGRSRAPLAQAADELGELGADRPSLESDEDDGDLVGVLEARLAAVTGQVTAAAGLAAAAAAGPEGMLFGRPSRGAAGFAPRLRADLERLRAAASAHSAPGRHALRLAVVVAGTELLVQVVALPRGYWAVVAAATVLRPSFGDTFTRGAERVLGTCAGVVIATLIADGLDPGGWGIVAIVGLLAFGTYTVFPASFAAGTALLTSVIVFLLHAVAPDSAAIALDRGLDTAIGGAIGLTAYALWPTWSASAIGPLLGTLIDAQHSYMAAVLAGVVGGRPASDTALRRLARSARVAWSDAEAAVTLARAEPVRRGELDADVAGAAMSALRRVVRAVHALRLAAGPVNLRAGGAPAPELGRLAEALGQALAQLAGTVRDRTGDESLPPLRRLYREAARSATDGPTPALRVPLDELIDAIDTVAATIGVALP